MIVLAQNSRVSLRRLQPGDLNEFMSYRSDREVARYQSWEQMTPDRTLRFLAAVEVQPLFMAGAWCQIGIANAQHDLMGDIGVFLSEEANHVELGITLARPFWGNGYATDAMKLAFELVWEETNVPSVRCWGDRRNLRSIALMRRLGMTHLGTEETDVIEEAYILNRPDKH